MQVSGYNAELANKGVLAVGGNVGISARRYVEFAWDGQLEIQDSGETRRIERVEIPFSRPDVQRVV